MAELSESDTEEIRELVASYFDESGIPAEVKETHVEVNGGEQQAGLINIFQRLADLPKTSWPDYIRWHFDSVMKVDLTVPADYTAARARLRIRLAPEGINAHDRRAGRPLCSGLIQRLMVRFDGGAFSLPAWAWDRWDVDVDRVWSDARSHTFWDEPRQQRWVTAPNGVRVGWVGGGFFASSMLLDLGRLLRGRPRHGSLAMVPTAGSLLYAPVGEDLIDVASTVLEIGTQLYLDGPSSISPDLFWWHDGRIERLVRRGPDSSEPTWSREFTLVIEEVVTIDEGP